MAVTPITDGADLERLRSLTGIKWSRDKGDILAAWVADMDLAPAPVAVEAVQALIDRRDFGYNRHAAAQIPEAFSAWQDRQHGWAPNVEELLPFSDVLHAIDMALWLHTKPGDGIVLLTPIYPPFIRAVEHGDRRLIDCPLNPDGWRVEREALEACIDDRTSAILMCNPHNPTGRVFSLEELTTVAEVAEANDLLILSDEIWGDVVHPGATHIPMPMVSQAAAARTITISAASKSFNLAGLRTAVAHIGHAELAEKFAALPAHARGGLSTPGAEATLASWTKGGPWLAEVLAHLTAQRDHLASRLASELPQVGFQLPEATYLNWLDFSCCNLGPEPATTLMAEVGVSLSPGSDFGHGGDGWVRLNVATSQEILDLMLDRIVGAVSAVT
ncbi:MAG: cystathionine beta-lyase [Acidimicrobiales bacterium]|jgi:cystathionine beta-lyase